MRVKAFFFMAGKPIKRTSERPETHAKIYLMPKVLILTAAYGEGHNAAARGLEAAFREHSGVEVTVLDPFVEAYGAFYERSRRDYLRMIELYPRAWAAVYQMLDRTPLIHAAAAVQWALRRELRRVIAELRPEVVVSVYPLFPYLLNGLAGPGEPRLFRLYTVVTDSITINSAWHRAPSDLYFVPNEESATVMRAAGVPGQLLRVLGFPVLPRFARERPERPAPETGALRVLYMINAGRKTAPALAARLLQIPGLQITITAGKDEALRAELGEVVRRSGRGAEIHGWTPRMPELLMTHHLLIGKAGGAAVQEAIAARTPMIITKVVPGQEEGNARLMLENGCAAVCESPESVAREIERLSANRAAGWHAWERNIARISRPAAALEIAECVLDELGVERRCQPARGGT
jgi:processive 1,2-diacylglycerol beta-glucosyltransferase